tara:strand:+ start:184 stop:558 length:375 start_codon:yes stop_codon:yes gene_type:complete
MRKITRQSLEAFINREIMTSQNMSVGRDEVSLHGNPIIRRVYNDGIIDYEITQAGWPTTTTLERLRGFIKLMKYPLYLYRRNGRTCLKHWHHKKVIWWGEYGWLNPLALAMELENETLKEGISK